MAGLVSEWRMAGGRWQEKEDASRYGRGNKVRRQTIRAAVAAVLAAWWWWMSASGTSRPALLAARPCLARKCVTGMRTQRSRVQGSRRPARKGPARTPRVSGRLKRPPEVCEGNKS